MDLCSPVMQGAKSKLNSQRVKLVIGLVIGSFSMINPLCTGNCYDNIRAVICLLLIVHYSNQGNIFSKKCTIYVVMERLFLYIHRQRNHVLHLSLCIYTGLYEQRVSELPWRIILLMRSNSETSYRPKTIMEYSGLASERRSWTHATAKRSLHIYETSFTLLSTVITRVNNGY